MLNLFLDMLESKSFQLISLVVFLLVNLYLVFAIENEITFILVYGGYVLLLAALVVFSIIFFIAIKYQLNGLYYSVYFLSVGVMISCLGFTLKKPVQKALEERRIAREAYENSGGRGVFKTELETEAAVAIIERDTATLTRCINDGLDVNAVGDEGAFLVFAARNNAALPIFRILLNHGADPNIIDSSGNSYGGSFAKVLNSSTLTSKKEILKLSINKGMKIPEYWFFFDEPALSIFFEEGVSINEKFKVTYYQGNYKGKRITWSPDYGGKPDAIRKPSLRDAEWTPIMILASGFWLNKAKDFYDKGANVTFKDENGVDLLEILQSKKTIISNNLTGIIDDAENFEVFIQKIKADANSRKAK